MAMKEMIMLLFIMRRKINKFSCSHVERDVRKDTH